MSFDFLLTSMFGSLGQALLHAPIAIGMFLSLRVMKKPDLTIEGSFAFGAVIAITMMHHGVHHLVAIITAMIGGALAGLITSIIHTKLKIDGIISGLLVTMGIFSINLLIMGRSNISAPRERFIFHPLRNWFVSIGARPLHALFWSYIVIGAIVLVLIISALYLVYGTKFGLSIRATGDNERMACSHGVNIDSRKIFALVISNAISGLAGALVSQQQNGAEVNIGAGIFITAIAALVIGEVVTPKNAGMVARMAFIVVGAVIYFATISLIIAANILNADWTRLLTAALTLFALCIPKIRGALFQGRARA